MHRTLHRRTAASPRLAAAVAVLALLAGGLVAPAAFATDMDDPVTQAMIGDLTRATDKLVSLAEAIPADTYAWRPAEGVYSVSEALMHVASANFALSAGLGTERPDDLPDDPAAVTDKDEVVAFLKRSVEHALAAVESGAGDLAGEREMFGQTMSGADVAMILIGHNHEHLGQLIAYGRSNGVVPPWSRGDG